MTEPLPDRWNDAACEGFAEPDLLLYRSNLLGADRRVTNFGGGNTSAKVDMPDPLTGESTEVLWVKGSGGDLDSMQLDGFATLYLAKLCQLPALYRGPEHEDEMVGYLPHCTFGLDGQPASIDTPLHAFVAHRHVDHLHPDSVIAIAASRGGENLTRELLGDEVGWLPWQRPGFDLGLRLQEKIASEPGLCGVVLGGHGLVTWGETSRDCYRNTLRVINRAAEHLAVAEARAGPLFGKEVVPALPSEERRALARRLMPLFRGRIGRELRRVGHFTDAADVLEFVGAEQAAELCARGTSCPDHFLRTKVAPLFIDAELVRAAAARPAVALPAGAPVADPRDAEVFGSEIDALLSAYRDDYRAYYDRCRRADSPPMRDPNPVVVLLPGVGMMTFAEDKPMARQAAELCLNAIRVMRGASLCGGYVGLPEQAAFDIEYWALEEREIRRMPPERSLARRVALITGGAGGIGRAAARRLLGEGASVVLVDIDQATLAESEDELRREFGPDLVRSIAADVTEEAPVRAAVAAAVDEYGGLDVLVCSAGLASAAAFADTSLDIWLRNLDVLTTGYFLVAREAFIVMQRQGTGGSIVFVGSKNALAASPQASAYSTAKAAVLHLARGIALEGAPHGIRVNTVNPDAVLEGSRIWSSEWREDRAEADAIEQDQLEEPYRKRSLLGLSVRPSDVAEAILFFAGEASSRSTANILNVDAGNPGAFPR